MDPTELRIATIGNVDAGKSTLVGVLTRDFLDDGRGKARSVLFRHKHEKDSGRTSAIGVEVMGMDDSGKTIRSLETNRTKHFQHVRTAGKRIITFVDLAGHERYLKTTISGLTGLLPDYCLVIVGLNMGVSKMTREHLGLSAALDIPPIIVCTKVDIAPPDVAKHTMESITKVLRAARKMPYVVRSSKDVATAATTIAHGKIAPIITISNVTGEGMDLLKELIHTLPPRALVRREGARLFGGLMSGAALPAAAAAAAPPTPGEGGGGAGEVAVPVEGGGSSSPSIPAPSTSTSTKLGRCTIDSVFSVPGVGTVVAGMVYDGVITVGATMVLGPSGSGEFLPVTVRSIEINYTPYPSAGAGVSAAFAIRLKGGGGGVGVGGNGSSKASSWCRKGMQLLDPSLKPLAHWGFAAESLVLHHSTTVKVGYAPQCHVGVCSQSAEIVAIEPLGGAGAGAGVGGVGAVAGAGNRAYPPGGSPNKAHHRSRWGGGGGGGGAAAPEQQPHGSSAEALVGSAAGGGGGAVDESTQPALRTGDRALLSFTFLYKPEYLRVGDLLLFREGRSKGVGRITKLLNPHGVGGDGKH